MHGAENEPYEPHYDVDCAHAAVEYQQRVIDHGEVPVRTWQKCGIVTDENTLYDSFRASPSNSMSTVAKNEELAPP